MDIEKELKDMQQVEEPNDSEISADLILMENMERAKSEEKAKRKEEKKRKRTPLEKKLEGLLEAEVGSSLELDGLADLAETIKKNKKKRKGKLSFDLNSFTDDDGEKRKKKKDLRKQYEAQYRDESAMLTALLKETNEDIGKFRSVLDKMLKTSVRGASKTLTDLASTVVSANGNRLQIIKAKIDIKNKITDFVLKEQAKKKNDDEGVGFDQEAFGAQFMQNLFTQGNKEFTNSLQSTPAAISQEEYDSYLRETPTPHYSEPVPNQTYTEQAPVHEQPSYESAPTELDTDLQDNLNELSSEYEGNEIFDRSEAGDKLIEYESAGVNIKIRRWIDSSGDMDWEFVAVDREGTEIYDYEVPSKEACSPVKFTDGSRMATDKFGRSYEIIDVN